MAFNTPTDPIWRPLFCSTFALNSHCFCFSRIYNSPSFAAQWKPGESSPLVIYHALQRKRKNFLFRTQKPFGAQADDCDLLVNWWIVKPVTGCCCCCCRRRRRRRVPVSRSHGNPSSRRSHHTWLQVRQTLSMCTLNLHVTAPPFNDHFVQMRVLQNLPSALRC